MWLLIVYDVLRYEVHIPLVLVGGGLLVFALITQLFPLSILWGGVVFFGFFMLMYWGAKWLVQIKYQLKEEGI
ncbi:MAG: hypothetical protein Q4B28_08255 [bacterium]|nr:hypothetical protein [bacterium]